jgi:hypothetical protein
MHSGAGSSRGLMHYLRHHPSVRSYGMVTYYDAKSYDEVLKQLLFQD